MSGECFGGLETQRQAANSLPMATLVLSDVPDELNAALQASAERNHRTKEKEALHLLAASVGAAPVDWNAFFDRPRRAFPKDYSDEIRRADR